MYKRTNIEIDNDLINQVLKITKLPSIKEAVNYSLKQVVLSNTRKKILALRGKVKWEGDLDEMRKA